MESCCVSCANLLFLFKSKSFHFALVVVCDSDVLVCLVLESSLIISSRPLLFRHEAITGGTTALFGFLIL